LIRALAILLAFAAVAAPADTPPQPEFVQAVEFPYYLYPRALWDRELVWLKNIGVRTVEFSIPWNWHQVKADDFDFTGRTSPRRDLQGLIKLLRRLGLRAWIRPLPPVANWPNAGAPAGAGARAETAWLKALEGLLGAQTVSHGGPVACIEGRGPAIGAGVPPSPVTRLSAGDPAALARSRAAIAAGHGALLWTDVEDSLYPAGWETPPGSLLRHGAVGLSGDEHPATGALRRDAALLRNWTALLPSLHSIAMPKPAAGKLPDGVSGLELTSMAASAVSITNSSAQPFHDDLRVFEPVSKRTLIIPSVSVQPGESMWLPVSVAIGPNGLCRECSHFSNAEQIVYATAELLTIEYENGILAMEFAAPEGGEVILQLERQPVGPFLAAGKPSKFEWDDKTLRARLTIPANPSGDHRVRIGIAMEEPETSAFFNEARRLVIGQKNAIATSYSSPEVAARSRLRLPDGYSSTAKPNPPNEIDYDVAVPADGVHGDFANFAIEADGVLLGRARLQLFRPASVRIMEAIQEHIGQHTELTPEPPVAAIEPKAGTNLEVAIRNNWPGIQTFRLEATGDGLDFFPPKTEISIAAMDERRYSLRVFAKDGVTGLRDWHMKVTRGTTLDLPMRALLLPRGRTVAWSADLDGDGTPEWVLESARARAVFSTRDGGRWMEFTWKDTNTNFLPEAGAFAAAGTVEIRAAGDNGIEIAGNGWTRTVRLTDAVLTVEQANGVPADGLAPQALGNVHLSMRRVNAAQAVYTLQ
jgi:hypothetical protein